MRELKPLDALSIYEEALRGTPSGGGSLHAVAEDGSRRQLPLARWLAPPDAVEETVLARATGPVLDLGCGAGRHVVALRRRGIRAVGVEISPVAAAMARERGAEVIVGSAFDQPTASGWATILLLDGNIGIGGDAKILLRRAAELLAPRGQVLVELEAPAGGSSARQVRLERAGAVSHWLPWQFVDSDEIAGLARAGGLFVARRWSTGGRWFAELRREGNGCAPA